MPRLRCASPRIAIAPNWLGTGATAGTGFSRTDGRSAAARGYDASWRRLRLAHLQAHPQCAQCERQGRQTPATQVHHIVRFVGLDDPLRLDPRNCESICDTCHRRETARQSRGTG